jgi:hypothetical protein
MAKGKKYIPPKVEPRYDLLVGTGADASEELLRKLNASNLKLACTPFERDGKLCVFVERK